MEKSSREITGEGKKIVNQISVMLRNGRIHRAENEAIISSIERFRDLVNPFIELEGFLRMDFVGEFFYINDTRIRYPLEFLLNFDYLAEAFMKRELGSLEFTATQSTGDLRELLKAMIECEDSDTPFDMLQEKLEPFESIGIERYRKIADGEAQGGEADTRKIVKKTYFSAVSFSRGIMARLRNGEKVNKKKAKRVVESIVELILSEDQYLMGMTAIKDYDDYTYYHSVNVSVLSIAIGRKLGLNRTVLTELGLAAFFHDAGKVAVPIDILNKPSELNESEWTRMKKHPYYGALALLRLRGIDRAAIQGAIAAFQHHMHYDLSGYPQLREPMKLDYFSRIISIADQYDAITSSRVYSRDPCPPDEALHIMMSRAGTKIDPVLMKIFINMVGVYPVGSLVLLDTKEMGVVYQNNTDIPERPKIVIIIDGNGRKTEGIKADLAEKDDVGKFKRNIIKTLNPHTYGLNLAEYLLP